MMTLKAARELVKISQSELARLAGIDVQYVNALELGKIRQPSYEKVVLIVRGFQRAGLAGITAEQLFPVDDEPAPAHEVAS